MEIKIDFLKSHKNIHINDLCNQYFIIRNNDTVHDVTVSECLLYLNMTDDTFRTMKQNTSRIYSFMYGPLDCMENFKRLFIIVVLFEIINILLTNFILTIHRGGNI